MKNYAVDIVGLKNKRYNFDFEVNELFFKTFENDTLQGASLKVLLALEKSETMIVATVSINGFVVLVCDRSLKEFEYEIKSTETVYYKYGEVYEELSEDVITIPLNCAEIDFTQLIYDSIVLAIPPKVIHPDLLGVDEGEFTYSTEKIENEEEIGEEETDPRWAKLKKLKFNKN